MSLTRTEAITVRWPDSLATVTKYADVRANRDLTLTWGSALVVFGSRAY